MAYKLEVKHPDFPDGWEFDMDGVLVKNGSSVTLTEADEEAIFARSGGKTVKEVFGHKNVPDYIKLTGSKESDKKEGGE